MNPASKNLADEHVPGLEWTMMSSLVRVLLCLLSALLVFLSFPPIDWWCLGLVAWVPLVISIRGAVPLVAFRLGLLHGALVMGSTLSWLWNLFGAASVGLWLLFGLFTAFWAWLYVHSARFGGSRQMLLGALFWTGIEYFRSEVFWLKFPWITPGTVLPPTVLTSMIGVYGISFLVVLGALSRSWMGRLGWVSCFILVLTWEFLVREEPEQDKSYTVALVQSEAMFYEDYLDRSEDLSEKVQMMVWPEYALSFDPLHHPKVLTDVERLLSGRSELLVFGAREDGESGEWRNTSFVFGKTGLLGTHAKNHTVHFFDDGEPGEEAKAIQTDIGRVGSPICFDNDYQDVVRRMTQDGAEYFLIPSMDAIHWSARQHEQHAKLFHHRAAENGRWLAVASTSGVTQIIDERGVVRARLPLMEEGVLLGTVERRSSWTLYQRGGWVLGAGMMWLSVLMMVVLLCRKWQGGRVSFF